MGKEYDWKLTSLGAPINCSTDLVFFTACFNGGQVYDSTQAFFGFAAAI
jgi:hypothetical protein